MPGRTPLTTLLSRVWVAHTMEIDNAFEAVSADRVGRCVRISLPMWTNGLRHIEDEGVALNEVRARAHARCNIGGLERWGWISVGDRGPSRRVGYGSHRGVSGETVLYPTRAGLYARRAWPKVVEGVEALWRKRFGNGVVEELRTALLAGAAQTEGLPWSPPEVNPSNGFRTEVVDEPVGTVEAEPPLVALLGQALTAATLRHEGDAEVSLPLGANVLRVVDSATVRLRELPALSGISKEAIAMAVNYLHRRGLADRGTEPEISLTPTGLDALDGYRARCASPSSTRLRAALNDVLTRTAPLSAGLEPLPGNWRAESPYLAQTRRLVVDPIAALPWQPMVLHRGGWPDGS